MYYYIYKLAWKGHKYKSLRKGNYQPNCESITRYQGSQLNKEFVRRISFATHYPDMPPIEIKGICILKKLIDHATILEQDQCQ